MCFANCLEENFSNIEKHSPLQSLQKSTRIRYEICSKLTIKGTRNTSLILFCCLYCQLWIYFTPFSSVSIDDFDNFLFVCRVRAKYLQIDALIFDSKCRFDFLCYRTAKIKKKKSWTLSCITSQDGQTHLKILAAFAVFENVYIRSEYSEKLRNKVSIFNQAFSVEAANLFKIAFKSNIQSTTSATKTYGSK